MPPFPCCLEGGLLLWGGGGAACVRCVCMCMRTVLRRKRKRAAGLWRSLGVLVPWWCLVSAFAGELQTHTHTHTHTRNNIRGRKKNNSVLFSGVLPEEISPPLLLLVVVVISSSLLPFLSPPSLFSVSYVVFVCLLVFSGYTHQGIWWSLCRSLFPLCYFLASDASSHHSLSSIIMKTTHPQAAGGI